MYSWILGPPNIWETAKARTLKLKTPLDMVKNTVYSHTKQKKKENIFRQHMSYEHSSNGYNIKHLSPTAQRCC